MDHLRSGDQDQPVKHGETPSLLKMQNKTINKLKPITQKIRQVWQHTLVGPATQEAEVEDHLNLEVQDCSEP